MGRIMSLALLAAIVASCAYGGGGGGSTPSGGNYPAAPQATAKPVSSPLPSGNPDADNYGGY